MNKVERLQQNLPDGVDAALIFSPQNRRYFLGFPSTAGALVVTRQRAAFFIDFRYIEAARHKVQSAQVVLQEKLSDQLSAFFKENGVKAVAVESEHMTLSEARDWEERLPGISLLTDGRLSQVIGRLRLQKTPDELEKLRAIQALTDETFLHILDFIRPGRTEREIALEMEFFMRKKGADGVSFDFIVLTGKNTSMPHGVPSEAEVKRGDFVLMDFGGKIDGYCSDMTRTVAVGEIGEKQRAVYELVLEAQQKAIASIRAGVTGHAVDAVARELLEGAYPSAFGHGLGHGVGIDIHEEPRFSPGYMGEIPENVVISVEPGIYLPDEFGVRIEDLVVVKPDGVEDITHSPKKIIVL